MDYPELNSDNILNPLEGYKSRLEEIIKNQSEKLRLLTEQQAKEINGEALKKSDPAHAQDFEKNLVAFREELDALDNRIAAVLKPLKGRKFYVFHPAFGHFGEAYGLKQVAVETGGKEPSAKQLAALIKKARKENKKEHLRHPEVFPPCRTYHPVLCEDREADHI